MRVGVTEDGIDAREIAVDPIDAVLRFVEVSIGVTVRDRMQFLLVQNGMMLNLRDSVGAKAGALITTLGQVEIKKARFLRSAIPATFCTHGSCGVPCFCRLG